MKHEDIFKSRLREIRKTKMMSQKDLANRARFPVSLISHFEGGARRPSFHTLIKLAKALSVSIDWLVGRSPVEIVSGRVRAYIEDWPKIRKLESKLLKKHD